MTSVQFVVSCLWAPPVAIQFSVVSQYILTYTQKCVCFQFISLHHFSVHRLWRLSFLLFGLSDPCQFFSLHHIISLGTACGDSVFCSVEDFCASLCVFLSLSGPLCASLCFSEALSLGFSGLSGPRWASLGLSGPLRASLGLSTQ